MTPTSRAHWIYSRVSTFLTRDWHCTHSLVKILSSALDVRCVCIIKGPESNRYADEVEAIVRNQLKVLLGGPCLPMRL